MLFLNRGRKPTSFTQFTNSCHERIRSGSSHSSPHMIHVSSAIFHLPVPVYFSGCQSDQCCYLPRSIISIINVSFDLVHYYGFINSGCRYACPPFRCFRQALPPLPVETGRKILEKGERRKQDLPAKVSAKSNSPPENWLCKSTCFLLRRAFGVTLFCSCIRPGFRCSL